MIRCIPIPLAFWFWQSIRILFRIVFYHILVYRLVDGKDLSSTVGFLQQHILLMESPNVDNGVSASPILSPCSWFPDDIYCCLVHWGAFSQRKCITWAHECRLFSRLQDWWKQCFRLLLLLEKPWAWAGLQICSMMMLPQLPFGTNKPFSLSELWFFFPRRKKWLEFCLCKIFSVWHRETSPPLF